MVDPLLTQSGLLARIREHRDDSAWLQFVEIYAPVVYGFARRQGLQDADAADLTQEVLKAVAIAVRDAVYDPQRGKFRPWLYAVARNHLLKFRRDAEKRARITGTANELSELPANAADAELWDREYDNHVFHLAARRVRDDVNEQTWTAFWKTAVEGGETQQVAHELGMSVGAVYIAKSRVTARLKQQIEEFQQQDP